MKKIIISILILTLMMSSVGCADKLYDSDTIHNKAAYLSKLTRKTQVAVRNNVSDGEELRLKMTQKFPRLVNQFNEYSLFFKDSNGTAVLLMCNKEETKSLVEDAACTGSVEGGDFFTKELPCDFHLDITTVCITPKVTTH